jgi:putative oxidoreductase
MSLLHRVIAAYDRIVTLLERSEPLPLLLARLSVGWVMVESGWGKLQHLPEVVEFFRSLGIPAPELQAPFAAGSELLFGALLMLGLFTRLSAIPLMVIMTVAIVTAKREELHGISDLLGSIEYLYIALLLMLLVRGGGAWSFDRVLASKCATCIPRGGAPGGKAAG